MCKGGGPWANRMYSPPTHAIESSQLNTITLPPVLPVFKELWYSPLGYALYERNAGAATLSELHRASILQINHADLKAIIGSLRKKEANKGSHYSYNYIKSDEKTAQSYFFPPTVEVGWHEVWFWRE